MCEVMGDQSSFEHRDADAALPGNLDCSLVAGVGVADDAHARVGREHAFELLSGEIRAVRDDDHAGVLRVADARAAAVVDRHPGRAGGGVDQRVEQRPVGDGVGAVAHAFGLAVGRSH